MSKKTQRVSYLVGIRNALNSTEMSSDGVWCTYDTDTIKSILATIDATLKLDNIAPMPSNEIVEVSTINK